MAIEIPTLVLVDTGDGAAAESPTLDPVAQAGVPLEPSAPLEPPSGPKAADAIELVVKVADQEIRIERTEQGMWNYVALAWTLGGFDGVVQAAEALQAAISALRDKAFKQRDASSATRAQRDAAEQRARDHPNPDRAYQAAALHSAALASDRVVRAAQTAVVNAVDAMLLFKRIWASIATLEEQALRAWELHASFEYRRMLQASRDKAPAEWNRYGCHVRDGTTHTTVQIDADDLDLEKVHLELTDSALEEFHAKALKLHRDALDLVMERSVTRERAQQVEGDPERAKAQKARQAHFGESCASWMRTLGGIEATDPVLIQVLPVMRSNTQVREFERMVVTALHDVFVESGRLLQEHVLLTAGPSLIIRPQRTKDGGPALASAYSKADWDVIRDGGMYGVVNLGLAVPASRVIAARLSDSDTAKNSIWLQRPTKDAALLSAAGHAKPELDAFTQVGTIEELALAEVSTAAREVRERHKTARLVARILVFASGFALSWVTAGGSVYVAGIVQAAMSVDELADAAKEYAAAESHAISTLSFVEAAAWARPSTARLVAQGVSAVIDVGEAALPEIPFVVDLAVNAAVWAVSPSGEAPPPPGPGEPARP